MIDTQQLTDACNSVMGEACPRLKHNTNGLRSMYGCKKDGICNCPSGAMVDEAEKLILEVRRAEP